MTLLSVFLSAVLISSSTKDIEGGWISSAASSNDQVSWIFSDGFYAASQYDKSAQTFTGTWGGSYSIEGNSISLKEEFNTISSAQIGSVRTGRLDFSKKGLELEIDGKSSKLSRVDDGSPGQLSGAWWITGRVTDGKIRSITPGSRRTMKILSGTRFQWIAYNVDTHEFFGTGGGTYSTSNGKYAETLEFFSRDSTRVGATLTFDFAIEEGKWHHRGLSSKGEPIDEFWSRRN